MATEPTYSISELAREFSITPRTIRHYEDQGLLAPHRAGQVRVYSKRDRTRLKLTLRGRRLGLSLAEIREMIELYDNAPDETTQLYKFLQALSRRRAQLEQQSEDIRAILGEVTAFENQCRELLEKRGRRAQAKPARRRTGERSAA